MEIKDVFQHTDFYVCHGTQKGIYMKKTAGLGRRYMELALYAFAGLGIEMLYAFLIEPLLYGVSMDKWTTGQSVIHWIVTCLTWGIMAYLIIKESKAKVGFDVLKADAKKMTLWQWLLVILCIALLLFVKYRDWGGFKPVIEFQKLGLVKFLFQYIYYAFETVLFMLILIFGQKACEVWFRKEKIPYGGIVVALTWGLVHILTKGSLATGILAAGAGFSFGVTYLLLNRDVRKVYPVLFIMFAL
jgi:hypothetical protein